MSEEITIYELLGLVKDGQAPKKIKFNEDIYTYHDKEHGYCKHHYDNTYICINSEYYLFDILNDKVEIIIEEDNEIEKGLKLYKDYLKDLEGDGCENYHNVTETQYLHRLSIIINELIDEVNKLKENNK